MSLPALKQRFTVDQYLRLEQDAAVRHEYHDGQVFEMSGGSYEHSLITANAIRALGNALVGSPCRVLESNLKVGIARSRRFVYPDLSVICGQPEFDPRDPQRQTVTNPRVVVEVLSPTTESYDRGAKFEHYCGVPSFEEYVLIAQDRPAVQTFFRQGDGTWLLTPRAGLEAAAPLRCLAVDLRLADLYAGVTFPPDPHDAP